jgi:DNA-binding transcriptional MerR regulator
MTIITATYDAKRAADLVGFRSVAMLDYLQRSGVFIARGSKGKRRGKGRRYEFRDLIVLKALKKLLDSGASVSNLRKSLNEFQRLKWAADPVTLEDDTGVVRFLIASGDDIYLVKDADIIVNLSRKGQLAFSFIIDLDNIRTEICAKLGIPSAQHEFPLPVAQTSSQ